MVVIEKTREPDGIDDDIVLVDGITGNSAAAFDEDRGSNAFGDEEAKEGEATHRQLGGAAVAGGLLGLVVAGPVVGVAAGIGAAVASTTKGKAGEVARASGDAMAAAGDRIKKWEKKHHVMEKTSNVVIKGCNKITRKLQSNGKKEREAEVRATLA